MVAFITQQFAVKLTAFKGDMSPDVAARLPSRISKNIRGHKLWLIAQPEQGFASLTRDGVIAQKSLQYLPIPILWVVDAKEIIPA